MVTGGAGRVADTAPRLLNTGCGSTVKISRLWNGQFFNNFLWKSEHERKIKETLPQDCYFYSLIENSRIKGRLTYQAEGSYWESDTTPFLHRRSQACLLGRCGWLGPWQFGKTLDTNQGAHDTLEGRGLWKPKMSKMRAWHWIIMHMNVPLWPVCDWRVWRSPANVPGSLPHWYTASLEFSRWSQQRPCSTKYHFLSCPSLHPSAFLNSVLWAHFNLLDPKNDYRKNIIMGIEPQICLCSRLP